MNLLNRSQVVPLCLALGLSVLPTYHARASQQSEQTSTPVSMTASVEAIDVANRVVTLKGPKGNLVDVAVDPSDKRFDTLKVGDQVKATYYESLAVRVRKPGDPAPTAGVTDSVTPPTGATGKTIARQVTTTVTIMAVDASVPSVTVKTAKGNVLSFRVQDPKRLEGIKAGDTVDVTYTQAILVSVEPVAK